MVAFTFVLIGPGIILGLIVSNRKILGSDTSNLRLKIGYWGEPGRDRRLWIMGAKPHVLGLNYSRHAFHSLVFYESENSFSNLIIVDGL
jgi:hypothetical protein